MKTARFKPVAQGNHVLFKKNALNDFFGLDQTASEGTKKVKSYNNIIFSPALQSEVCNSRSPTEIMVSGSRWPALCACTHVFFVLFFGEWGYISPPQT